MTKLFEATWREDWSFFERYFDTETQKSVKAEIKIPHEWYIPSSKGLYTYILDDSVKLEKKQGSAKNAKGNYGVLDPMYRNIRDNYWNNNGYNSEPRIWSLDIETRVGTNSKGFPVPERADEPICLMQIHDNKIDTLVVLGVRDWKHQAEYEFDYNVKYIQCDDEIHLLQTYNKLFKQCDPLIIYAWFGDGFDYPYIHNRMKKLGISPHEMSNYGDVKLTQSEYQGKVEFKFSTPGHFYIDLMVVYKKFELKPMPNYSLNTIAEEVLKKSKVNHTEYAGFDDFYTGKYIIPTNPTDEQKSSKLYQAALAGNWEEVKERSHSEFVYYGITDTYLLKEIDVAKNFTALMLMISEKMGVQMSDSMTTVKPWSQYISNRSMKNHQVMPFRKDHSHPDIVGGYVFEPAQGLLKWVLSGDATSHYPLTGMVGFNISPETFIAKPDLPPELRDIVLTHFNNQEEGERFDLPPEVWAKTTELLNEHNMALAINGAVFSKDKLGMIPEMVIEIFDSRAIAKSTMFDYQKRKILLKEILKEKKNGQETQEA